MKITFESMLDNAVDFFNESLNCYEHQKYKYAIINLWAGILLLFKCKLYQKEPCLIVANYDDCLSADLIFTLPEAENLKKTVDFKQIEDRFKKLDLESDIYKKYKQLGVFTNIQRMRNTVEHCINTFSRQNMETLYSETVPFIIEYMHEDLGLKPYDYLQDWDSFLAIKNITDTWQEYVERFLDENISSDPHSLDSTPTCDCPNCQSTAVLVDGIIHCENCGWETSDYYICSECGELISDGDFNYMASSGEDDDFGRMCSICFDNLINKD